jgi:mRNA interferase YafQ
MTTRMRRDIRRLNKRGADLNKLAHITDMLCEQIPLLPANKDHALTGDWIGFRECHIENDWVLIYQMRETELVVIATRTGSHSDFGW